MKTVVSTMLGVLALLVSGAFADTVPVSLSGGAGTRTMTLKTAGGAALSEIALGSSGASQFLVDVTDDGYSHVGFQVNMQMSNLYKYAGGQYDCGASVSSSAVSVSYPSDPTTIMNVAGLATPSFDLSGTLSGALATALGIADGTPLSVPNLSGESLDHALAGLFDGTEATLPIQVSEGAGGAFANRAAHATCDASGSATPTAIVLAGGTQNGGVSVTAWLESAIEDLADVNANSVIGAAELVTSGVVTDGALSAAVRDALATAGVDLDLLNSLLALGTISMDDIYALLTATLDSLTGLDGQDGGYVAIPQIGATVPGGATLGNYRGTATITIVDN